MQIRSRPVHADAMPFVLAEIGVNHDGDASVARRLIEAAASAGADAVKFQLFRADLLLASSAGLVDYQTSSAESADDLLTPLQMSPEVMGPLVGYAHSRNLAVVVTPFSPELVAACVAMNVDAIKLASPDLVNRPLLDEAIRTGLPLILSTGQADLSEIARTVKWLEETNATDRVAILQCVSSYPTPPAEASLGAIYVLRATYPQIPIGYSDHTIETLTAALAVSAGACILEKHLTLDRTRKGPDHAASLEPASLAEYVSLAKTGFAMRGAYRKSPLPIELQIRQQTRQSVASRLAISSGTVLSVDLLTVKRPGTGIPAAEFSNVVGKRAARDIAANSVLTPNDIAM